MPGGDGTGPMGAGPMSGWGRGPCGGGRGFRGAFGRGGGWGRGAAVTGRRRAWYWEDAVAASDERELLERRREVLERELREISARLDESRGDE